MFDYICCVILSVIIFKEVNLVNKRVLVVKALAYQRSLLRKLLKEATRKFLEKVFQGSYMSCLGKNAVQPSLTV